eukprot:12274619-Ditylum_brightwellii.AAC.1
MVAKQEELQRPVDDADDVAAFSAVSQAALNTFLGSNGNDDHNQGQEMFMGFSSSAFTGLSAPSTAAAAVAAPPPDSWDDVEDWDDILPPSIISNNISTTAITSPLGHLSKVSEEHEKKKQENKKKPMTGLRPGGKVKK